MQHVFVEPSQIKERQIVITGGDVRHIRDVLRMRPGEELSVSNGADGREYRCEIEAYTETEIICRLRFIKEEGVELPLRITLFQALPKADKMELVIQKAVELGASEIVPLAVSRCVARLEGKKADAKLARWQAISEAAAKQSRRAVIPRVREVMRMREAAAYAGEMELAAIPYELAEGMAATRELFQQAEELAAARGGTARLGILIGPEGGFTEEEIALAQEQGILPISLGRRILRTETAGMALLSALMLRLETDARESDRE